MRIQLLTGLSIVAFAACGAPTGSSPPTNLSSGVGGATSGVGAGTSGSGATVTGGGGGGTSTLPTGAPTGVTGSGAAPSTGMAGSGGAVGSVTPSAGTSSLPPSGGMGAGGNVSVGDPTCAAGIQTGSTCNPSADTAPCVRTDRTCECGGDSTWSCSSGSGGMGSGGSTGVGGAPMTGGTSAVGGASVGGAGTVELDCDAMMPTSGSEQHSATWAQGGSGNTAWQIWTNGGPGNLTTFGDTTAFIASWNNSGDYLGRMGFEWGNSGRQYTEYGTIKADYVWNKSGTAGQYSYLGIYGWSNNPCVEWYIVEDSFHQMPFNTGDQPVGTTEVDGGTYNLVYRHTQGTGGDRCGGAGSWDQFYSIRLEGKRCGTITVSDHFDRWAEQGWNLGNLLEVKIVVEAAAGQGSVEFPVANVTTSM